MRMLPVVAFVATATVAPTLMAASQSVASGVAERAARFVEVMSDRALEILAGGAESEAAQDAKLYALLVEGFDTERMSRALLGNGWSEASASQQADFRDAFEAYLAAHLTRVLKEKSPDDFEVRGARLLAEDRISVTTDVERFGVALAEVTWVLRDRGPDFEVVDVYRDGISLMETYRSEFRSLARLRGMDALTEALLDKVARR